MTISRKQKQSLRTWHLRILPNIIGENTIAFVTKLPTEFDVHKYVDYDTIFEKAFVEPLKNILNPIGWNTEPQATLEDLFG